MVLRFGRKAQTISIEGFIRGPLFNHLGITTDPLPPELAAMLPVPVRVEESLGSRSETLSNEVGSRTDAQSAVPPGVRTTDDDGVADPELSVNDLFDLVSWAMLLAPPKPDELNDETRAGKALFQEANCSGCHVEALDSPRGLIPLYSDLLLHNMGPELADGVFQQSGDVGLAFGDEFRTQPLWGIGVVGPYLHDGRADTLDEAIRWHGGEAQNSRDAYVAMSEAERSQLIAFLNSLGGADQKTEGLLPPGSEIPAAGEYGAPARALNADEAERYHRGRELFDRDFYISEGLGPTFNGDSCRACHFDPIIGGAGPSDVDVTRHGSLVDGVFSAPMMGTMSHHHGHGADRAPFDDNANVIELRQTPVTFGLGRIEQIPEALIVAAADPEDLDGDGISGRVHRLGDGRLGRFGWKGGVPSVREFTRDALSNEIGLTLPAEEGLTFGFETDMDDSADPEVAREDLEALVFFIQMQAPPPRTRSDVGLEDAGESRFAAIGCASCHATLQDDAGEPVRLYSDLLLHDVGTMDAVGIADGGADFREFRTPPLWGLATTAPYLHDGRAETVETAIARHDGEATAARQAYEALDATARAELIAFLQSL